jgi:tetratricopeptide (TPR) repeat protein
MGENHRVEEIEMQALPIFRAVDDKWLEGLALSNLGLALSRNGQPERAEVVCGEALATFESLGGRDNIQGIAIICMAEAARYQGERERASQLYSEALKLDYEANNYLTMPTNLMGLGLVAMAGEKMERAATIFGVLAGLEERLQAVILLPSSHVEREEASEVVQKALGEKRWTRNWERGRAMNMEQAVRYVLNDE